MANQKDWNSKMDKTNLLIALAKEGLPSEAKAILRDCDINGRDDKGRTALMYAAWNGRYEFTRMLLAHGAHVHILDEQVMDAFQLAALEGHDHIIELLDDFMKCYSEKKALDDGIAERNSQMEDIISF